MGGVEEPRGPSLPAGRFRPADSSGNPYRPVEPVRVRHPWLEGGTIPRERMYVTTFP